MHINRRTFGLLLSALVVVPTASNAVGTVDAGEAKLGAFTRPRMPAITPIHLSHFQRFHVIECSRGRKTVTYYRHSPEGYQGVVSYAATVPDRVDIRNNLMVGRVRSIQYRPTWCPTASMGGGACYGAGDVGNPMGQVAKFIIEGFGYQRLHGNEPGRSPRTAGCFSIQDPHMGDLLERLGSGAVQQGITVIFTNS